MSNIREDFIKARHILATHRGGIKERLIAAGRCGITVYEADKLPQHLREDYSDLVKDLTQGNGIVGDGLIEQTVNGISEDEAVGIADFIMNFSTNLLNTPRSEFK
jgi:hypothetical protein